MKIHDTSDKTYVILGGHRNGTSFVTHALKEQGIDIRGNANGHVEDIDFVNLNMDIIQKAGGIWKNPPPANKIEVEAKKHLPKFKELVESKKTKFWGWKDPRQALTMEHLVDVLEDDVYLICVFRKPERIAKSLKRTDGIVNGIELTKYYARSIVRTIERFMKI